MAIFRTKSTFVPLDEDSPALTPRIICLGHALKETLDVRVAMKCLEVATVIGGGIVVGSYCLSDGGDGFLNAWSTIHPGQRQRLVTGNAVGRLAMMDYLYMPDERAAAIETARIAGMAMIPPSERDIMRSSTRGIGDVILHALTLGVTQFHVGLGGSATCDGGVGLLQRLGEGLLNRPSAPVTGPAALASGEFHVDIQAIRSRLANASFEVYCDVENPLLGPTGSARVFGPQKGATPAQVEQLEAGLDRFCTHLEGQIGQPLRDLAGAGAAGGLGMAFAALGGRLELGADRFLKMLQLDQRLRETDGLVTCEGRFDASSFHGKAPWRAAQWARKANRFAVIACGSAEEAAAQRARATGITVLEFARDVAPERRSAEAFGLLQRAVSGYIRSIR